MAYMFTETASRENVGELNQCLELINTIPNLEAPISKLVKKIELILSKDTFVQKEIDSLRDLLGDTIRQTAATPAATPTVFRRLSFCDIPEHLYGESSRLHSSRGHATTPLLNIEESISDERLPPYPSILSVIASSHIVSTPPKTTQEHS